MDEKFLKEIKENLNKQDNRATADPIFVVYDWERIPTDSDYSDVFMFVGDEGKIAEDREELFKWLRDTDTDKSIIEKAELMVDDYDMLKLLEEEAGYDYISKIYYIKKRIFINVFFTEESANDFIKQNHYHYTKDVHIYVNCLWRNPEMQGIRNALKEDLIALKK